MRILVHLSDLHFGRVDNDLLQPLIAIVNSLKPDLITISGDLTQRARRTQFKEAQAFLRALPQPQIIVPGNHDIPLYNVLARFFWPLLGYRRYITADLAPFYRDAEIAVLGINTARSFTTKYGRINTDQVASIRQRMCSEMDQRLTKILVTHHPFDLPPGSNERELVGQARIAMEALAICGADVLLAGHLHLGHTLHSTTRYRIAGHSALIVSAGTATSIRHRGEPNSFNVLHIRHPYIRVSRWNWHAEAGLFVEAVIENFQHTEKGWVRMDGPYLTFPEATNPPAFRRI